MNWNLFSNDYHYLLKYNLKKEEINSVYCRVKCDTSKTCINDKKHCHFDLFTGKMMNTMNVRERNESAELKANQNLDFVLFFMLFVGRLFAAISDNSESAYKMRNYSFIFLITKGNE